MVNSLVRSFHRQRLFVMLALCIFALGCGRGDMPELGEVSGTVTLDGKPLVGSMITFKPEVGRPAAAVTDSEGKYVLQYRYGVEGSKTGKNFVSFGWPTGAEPTASIPTKYSESNAFTKEIETGSNVFDFELVSK